MARRRVAATRPIIIKQAAPKPKRRSRRRSAGGLLSAGADSPVTAAIGGYAMGTIDKMAEDNDWPTLPVIGRTGTIGLVAYYFRRSHPLVKNIAHAGLAVAGYQLARTGSIEGVGGVGAGGAVTYDEDADDDDDDD